MSWDKLFNYMISRIKNISQEKQNLIQGQTENILFFFQ